MSVLRFGIIGTYQTGKSLLVNCLLGRHVTTVGLGAGTTHSIVNYYYSQTEYIEILYLGGITVKKSLDNLHSADSDESVLQIDVYINCPFLKDVVLTDTPGVGYLDGDNIKAIEAIKQLDYAIVLVSNEKVISYADPLYQNLDVLNRYNIPFYWFMNCVHASDLEKWDTESDINKMIAMKDHTLIEPFHPTEYPYIDNPIRVINLIWYWYSICPNSETDEIIKPYLKFINGNGINEVANEEIRAASKFYLIQELFNMDNRAYLELKKEIQYEIAKLRVELCPIGTIQAFSFNSIPAGWMFCNGKSLEIKSFPELYSKIGTTYGGDGENPFNIPDLRGQFVRGWDDREQRDFGSVQLDAVQDHNHKIAPSNTKSSGGHVHKVYYRVYKVGSNVFKNDMSVFEIPGSYDSSHSFGGDPGTSSSGVHSHAIPELVTNETVPKDGQQLRLSDETRPKNTALYYCIKVI